MTVKNVRIPIRREHFEVSRRCKYVNHRYNYAVLIDHSYISFVLTNRNVTYHTINVIVPTKIHEQIHVLVVDDPFYVLIYANVEHSNLPVRIDHHILHTNPSNNRVNSSVANYYHTHTNYTVEKPLYNSFHRKTMNDIPIYDHYSFSTLIIKIWQ